MKVKLCKRCGTKIFNPARNTKYCVDCKSEALKEYSKNYYKECYSWLKSNHICTRCGHKRAETGRVLCSVCLEKSTHWRSKTKA